MANDNVSTLRRWLEACNTHDVSLIQTLVDEMFSPEFTLYDGSNLGMKVSLEGIKEFVSAGIKDPRFQLTIHDLFGEGDLVCARYTLSALDGTSGKVETSHTIDVRRFENGKMIENWVVGAPAGNNS